MNSFSSTAELLLRNKPVASGPIVLAGVPDDSRSAHVLNWVQPLLRSVPDGNWESYELDMDGSPEVFVRYRNGRSPVELGLTDIWSERELAHFRRLFPACSSFIMLIQAPYVNQLLALLDEVASQVLFVDPGAPEVAPLFRQFGMFQKLAAAVCTVMA